MTNIDYHYHVIRNETIENVSRSRDLIWLLALEPFNKAVYNEQDIWYPIKIIGEELVTN